MSTLAIDRFHEKGLPAQLEEQAQETAARMRPSDGKPNYPLLLGYLEASVAYALEKPRWASRDRLAVDLRVVEILATKRY